MAHLRQAIFVKEAGLWFLVDIMLAPDSATHSYQQVWCFDHGFPRESVTADAATGVISTNDRGKPSLLILQANARSLRYQKHYAEGNHSGRDKVALEDLTLPAEGWQDIVVGEREGDMVPAVTLHTEWEGNGRQTMLSALVPSRTEESPLVSQERVVTADRVGITLKLKDGCAVSCFAARIEQGFMGNGKTVHLAVSNARPGEDEHGLLLDSLNTTGVEYVCRDKAIKAIAPVRAPSGFRWAGRGSAEAPDYSSHKSS